MHGEEGKRYIDKDLMIELLVTIAISQTNLSSAYSDSQYESYFIKVRLVGLSPVRSYS